MDKKTKKFIKFCTKILDFIMRGKMRKENLCNCVEMVDIGAYNSCKHLCRYCYANYDEAKVNENYRNHDVNSSLLIGHLTDKDTIKVRKP